MKRNNGFPTLGSIYGDILKNVETVEESSVPKGGNDFNSQNPAPLVKGGPSTADGYNASLEDPADFYGFTTDEDEEDGDDYNELETCSECGQPEEQCKCEFDEDEEDDVPERQLNSQQHQEADERRGNERKKKELGEVPLKRDEDEEVLAESTKRSTKTINKDMSRKELSFNNLYRHIISENFSEDDMENDDIDSLGLGDATPDSDMDEDFGADDESGDEVTITLDRAAAKTLLDVLQAAVGGDDVEGGDEPDFDFDEGDDDAGEDDDFGNIDFDEDEETLGSSNKLQGKDNKVGKKPRPGSNSADSSVTDKVGNDGDLGHALVNAKAFNNGKQNKVSKIKQGDDFFQ